MHVDGLDLVIRGWLLVVRPGRALWLSASGEWRATVGRC